MSHMRAAPKQGQGNGELQRVQSAECGVRPGKVTARKALLYESYLSISVAALQQPSSNHLLQRIVNSHVLLDS